MAEPRVFLDSLASNVPLGTKSGSAQADQFSAMRDDRIAYFGSDGDVEMLFDSDDAVGRLNLKGAGLCVEGLNLGDREMLRHQFGGKLVQLNASVTFITDQDFEILGTNASNDDVTNDPEGGIVIETDGAANDQVILLPHLDANQTPWTTVTWGTDQAVRYECSIKTKASITGVIIWCGLKLTNTSTTATDDHQAFFRYQDGVNSGRWQCITSVAGVDTTDDSNVTVAVSTVYRLVVVVDVTTRKPSFYINGAFIVEGPAMTDAIDLIPYIGVQGTGAAAKSITARHCGVSRKYA